MKGLRVFFGLFFLGIAVFMFYDTFIKTQMYLELLGASFADMKGYCVKTMIENVAPYLGISVLFFCVEGTEKNEKI